jgi:hypothetical protein
MKDYKVPLLVGLVYVVAVLFLPFVRVISIITLIFLALHFSFHGVLGLLGKRAERFHNRFIETHFATALLIGMYGLSTFIYFTSVHYII